MGGARRGGGWSNPRQSSPWIVTGRQCGYALRNGALRLGREMTRSPDDFGLLLGPDIPSRGYRAGEAIFIEGDHAEEFYVIRDGVVEIRSGNRLLETLGPNEIFGEMR